MRSLALLSLLALACERAPPAPAGDPAIFKAATAALDKRLATIRDYQFEGTARSVDTGATVAITYAFMQPQFARGTLGADQTVVFDGETVLALDHKGKTFAKFDKSGGDERFLMAIHGAFSEFACEGWRPPLMKPTGTSARAVTLKDGAHWVLTVAIDDEELKEEQLVLRASDGAFVEKRTVDKAGKLVAKTVVLDEITDPATGFRLPKRWQRTGPGGTFEISLDKATVNAGIARESFTTAVPEGYNPAT